MYHDIIIMMLHGYAERAGKQNQMHACTYIKI